MNKIFNNPQQAAASKMNEMPSALEIANKIIEDNPELFPKCFDKNELTIIGLTTRLMIMKGMGEYKRACDNYLKQLK